MSIWERLGNLDRRWVFVGIALAVILPITLELELPLGKTTPPTRQLYDVIEKLEPGDPVMIAFDYGPSSMPELDPMAKAIVRHCLSRKLRVVCVALWPTGTALARDVLASVGDDMGAVDGKDYVNLGYKAGTVTVIMGLGEDILQVYPQDAKFRRSADLEIMKGVRTFKDVPYVVDLAAGNSPFWWIGYAHERYQQELGAGITAVMATDLYPFLQTGQVVGLINGLKGAAEYEHLIKHHDMGVRGMAAQSIAHLWIILLVIVGNIAYFASRRAVRG
jgi:hypothetical protein